MEIINSVKSLVRRLLYNSIVPSWHLDEEGLLTPIPPNVWGTPEGLAAIDSSLELSLTLTNDNGESRQVQVYPMVKDGALLDAFRSEKEGRPPMRTVGNVITIVKDYVSGVQSKVDQLGLSDDDPQDDVCPPGDSTGALEKLERPKVSARQLLTAVIERWPTDHANPKTEFLRLLVRKHCGMTRGPYTSLRKEMLENGTMPSDWTNPGKRLLPELSDDKVDGLIAEILDELTSHH